MIRVVYVLLKDCDNIFGVYDEKALAVMHACNMTGEHLVEGWAIENGSPGRRVCCHRISDG